MAKTKRKTKSGRSAKKSSKSSSKSKTKTIYVQQPMSIGAQIGHGLQKFAESTFAKIFGKGDYAISENITDISKNSLMGQSMKPPSFADAGKGTFVFEHSEYCRDIVSSSTAGAFKVEQFNINPSDPDLFPWLSGIAANFEYYMIEGLLFRYVSTSGESVSSTNTTLGSVMMYVNPDIYDPVVLSKSTLLQYEGCVDAKPSKSIMVGAECDPKRMVTNKFYVGAAPPGSDRRFNDFGQLVVATNGLPGTSVVCGELWAHYRIRFFTAKVPDNDLGAAYGNIRYVRSGGSSSNPLGTTAVITKSNIPGVVVDNTSIQFDTVKDAYYLFSFVWNGGSVTSTAPSTTIANGTLTNYFQLNTNSDAPTWGYTNGRQMWQFLILATTDANMKVTLGTAGTLPTSSVVDINVERIPRSFV
jgi:hypothetical protein